MMAGFGTGAFAAVVALSVAARPTVMACGGAEVGCAGLGFAFGQKVGDAGVLE